ncbi:hypothetical protein V8F20_001433 [Naviculisporaceae sp. PSN 640]
MLSHLRFHRRAPSNPTSPLPDQLSSWEATAIHDHPQTAQDVSPRPDSRPRSSNSAQLPPVLPPIARVTSADSEFSFPISREPPRPVSQDSRHQPLTRPGNDAGKSGFIGGIALQNRMAAQTMGMQQQPSEPATQENLISRSKPPPPPINTGFTSRLTPVNNNKHSSFVTPTDLAQSSGIAGKRPAGARMASEPVTSTTAPETHKGKRGLPFLKNPMSSLLMRRKTAQPAPELQPLPDIQDPRIKGTKVHDFSAPRPKRVPTNNTTSPAVMHPSSDPDRPQSVGEQNGAPLSREQQTTASFDPRIIADLENHITKPTELDLVSPEAEQFSVRKPDRPPPPVPEKDASSVHTSSSTASRTYSVETAVMPRTTSSRRSTKSNHPSLSRASTRASVMSSIPKHMKSTSSRFSFDMIGSANQEKILEERHRQREQEKKTNDEAQGPRDSRYDEFDDDFDYDAMMDDDGLEERIPGVNADYEDEYDDYGVIEEEDPDNDQENFAGFVFQRSNPSSSLASPHTPGMLATPRDANGKVIGFALTKDTTPDLPPAASPLYLHDMSFSTQDVATAGLGIGQLTLGPEEKPHDAHSQVQSESQPLALDETQARTTQADELYFDDGLADELDFEHNDPPFDESIFDNLDTDQYGRPIPGAFALAQEAMKAAQQQQQQVSKRQSDEVTPSQVSGPSGASQSTAHTSLSTGLQAAEKAPEDEQRQATQQISSGIPGQDLLYQAALAAAAQKAAASGKFNRSESPPLPTELTVTSPTDSSVSFQPSGLDSTLDDYETNEYNANDYEAEDDYNPDDYESAGQYATYIDDDDFDDDVIAEANASALANDSDGFYGQEFGFYSAPLPQPHHGGHSHQNSTSSTGSTNNVPLSAENLFQYANGGYFGPSGAGLYRSKSGRVVSREPNLTPITERSEYSNRNSVMSLALPPIIGGEGAGGRSSSAGMPSSPGLAQLALMSSDDDTMSMSALMRLRSKAWGGSQASGLSSREGSPKSERASAMGPPNGPDGASSPFGGGSFGSGLPPYQHTRKNSNFSVWSANSDVGVAAGAGESGPGSPTVTMMMPQPQSYPQTPFGTGSGFTSPLAASPFPPPDAACPLQQQLYIPSPMTMPMPSAQSPAVGHNTCSPVLETDSEETGYEDEDDQDRTLTGLQPSPCPPMHLPAPNSVYPSWTNTPSQAQAAARMAMMGTANGHINGTGLSNFPVSSTIQTTTGGAVNSPGGGSSGPPSPQMLMRRPASASGSASATGFAHGNNSGKPGSGMGHRHKGSADSISYVREDLPGGDGENGVSGPGGDDFVGSSAGLGGGKTRWVMERRRTDESTGEVEILEREVVEAGRI